MKKFLQKTIWTFLICFYFFQIEKVQAIVPYYYFPKIKNLQKQSLNIGKNAYQLLYFGQYEDSLNLAKLAVKINAKNEKLWLILAEAQIANKEYKNALNSLNKAEQINSNISEIYFAKSNIFLKISQQTKAKIALEKGIEIEPNNYKAIFQLGNILLMEKNYLGAIKLFDKSIKIKPDFWQAINNQGLAYFEKNNAPILINDKKTQQNSNNDNETVNKIIEVLDTKIRPAVARDGGDIKFKSFENGVVKVELQGSCSGCPSSLMTLKQGVQNLLKHYVKEVNSVEAN